MPGWKEISEFVLRYDYCCGCGVCAGVCPQSALEIRFNEYGEYKPFLVGQCTDCGLCSKVCPFVNGNPNEDEMGRDKFGNNPSIKHRSETGYYLDSYVGHATDPEIRWNGASGGLTTVLLSMLLQKHIVDYVITVAPTGNPKKLFEYRVLDDSHDVRECSKSAYYPVELSRSLQFVRANDKRFALVGLPCFIKAVELASIYQPVIRERIVLTIGLACGHLCSTFLADYLIRLRNVDRDKVRRVSFREKETNKPSNIYLFKCFGEEKNELCHIYWQEGYAKVYLNDYFKLASCGYCDDIFAEVADTCVMDAWLGKYCQDARGTNIVLVRNPVFREMLKGPEVKLSPIRVERVIDSQKEVVRVKRNHLAYRLQKTIKKNAKVPDRRIAPSEHRMSQQIEIDLKDTIQTLSRRLYSKVCDTPRVYSLSDFMQDMEHLARLLRKHHVRPEFFRFWERNLYRTRRLLALLMRRSDPDL